MVFVLAIIMLVIIFTLLGTLVYTKKDKPKKWLAGGVGEEEGVNLAISDDGISWTGIDSVKGEVYDIFRRFNGRWVLAVGGNEDYPSNIYWSDDAETWNSVSGPFGADGAAVSVYYANGIWVITGINIEGNAELYWSYNAETWTQVTNINAGGYANVVINLYGTWFLGVYDPTNQNPIYRSINGIDWEVSETPSEISEGSCFYRKDPGGIILSGGNNSIVYSEDDGLTWSLGSLSPSPSDLYVSIITFFNQKYYAFNSPNTDNQIIYSSTDGKSWSGEGIISDANLNDYQIVGNKIYVVGELNDNGFYLIGTTSGKDVTWEIVDNISLLQRAEKLNSILKVRDSPIVVGGKSLDDGEINVESLFNFSPPNSWEVVENNPFGDNSRVNKIYYG